MKRTLVNIFYEIGNAFNFSKVFRSLNFRKVEPKTIKSDWNAVGKDIKDILNIVDEQIKEK